MPAWWYPGTYVFSSLDKDRLEKIVYITTLFFVWPKINKLEFLGFNFTEIGPLVIVFRNSDGFPTVRCIIPGPLKVPIVLTITLVGILTPWMPWILNKNLQCFVVLMVQKSRFPTTLWMVLKLKKPCKSCEIYHISTGAGFLNHQQ